MKRWPLPLRFSIPGVLLGLGVVVLAASVRYELAAADERADATITQRAQLLSLVLSAQLERSYRERRPSDARNIVLQASADRALRRTILFDQHRRALDGMPVGVSGHSAGETPFADDLPLLDEMRANGSSELRVACHGDHLNSYVPVILSAHEEELLSTGAGVLAMEFDLGPTRSEERVRVVWRAIGIALALAAVTAMLWLFFQFSLLRRVKELVAATRRFAAGDLSVRAHLKGSDELVHLAQAFDHMAEAISVNRQALVEAEQHASFLAEVSQHLAVAFDTGEPLYALAKLAVPVVGEACFVHVSGEQRTAVAYVDPNVEPILQAHADAPLGGALLAAIETGETQLSPAGGARLADALGASWPSDAPAGALPERGAYIVVPLRARARMLGAIAVVSKDVRRYEDPRLRLLAEDMAGRAALNVDNSRLYREMQRAVRMRDEFLTVAAHELRTPCTSLRLAVDMLCRAPPEARAQRMLELLARDSQRLATLVDRLLDVSRIMAAELAIVLEPVDLTAAVREVAATLAATLERSGTKLTVEVGDPIVGQWDLLRVQQVVTNLLVNAMKYGRGRPIRVCAEQSGGMARLTVEDHGIGIAPEHQAMIFERFERAVSSRHYGGLGLGLYIVRRIVEALGGSIHLTSELDVGSTFVVELPLSGPKVRE